MNYQLDFLSPEISPNLETFRKNNLENLKRGWILDFLCVNMHLLTDLFLKLFLLKLNISKDVFNLTDDFNKVFLEIFFMMNKLFSDLYT